MAVTIFRYPGGLEYPEQFKSNVQGLTPIGSYTLSDQEAIARFPGLQYSLKPSSSSSDSTISSAPVAPNSYTSIQAVGLVEPAKEEEDAIYDISGNTYEQAYQKYLQQIEDNKTTSASLQKDVDDARAIYLSGLKDPAEIRSAYDKLQSAIKASSDYASSFLKSPLTAPRKEDFTNIKSYAPTFTTSPESEKNLSIVEDQAASGSEEAQAFLDQYKESADLIPKTFAEPEKNLPIVESQTTLETKEPQSFLDQYKETSLNNIPQETETLIASTDTSQKPSGPSTPVKYDPVMKQYVPNVDPGKVLLEILKQAKTGPRGEAVAQAQFGPRGEDIAQVFPTGPRGMDRPPGTYHPSNIMPLQTPGSKWRPGEGYMIQNPFDRSPQTGPGLSQNQEEETKPEFDKQRALVASKAADEYRRSLQSEDPFRTSAFG
jgi:hypothetical protein